MEKNDQTQAVDDFEDIPEELKKILDALIGPRYRKAERMAGIAFLVSMCGYMINHMEDGENPEERRNNVMNNFCRSLSALGVTEAEAEEAMTIVDAVSDGPSSEDEFHWTPGAEDE